MTITNHNTNTDRDEEIARSLQEQLRTEAPLSAWSPFNSMFFSGDNDVSRVASTPANRNNGIASRNASRPSTSALPAVGTGSYASGLTNNGTNTPKYKKTSSNSSPDTVATAASGTPSPDRCNDGSQLVRSNNERRPNKIGRAPRSSPRSTPRSLPRSSPRGSPTTSPRNSFTFTNTFIDTTNDENVARKLEQELRDAELAASMMNAERASSDFAVERLSVGNIVSLPSRGDGFDVDSTTRTNTRRGRSRRLDSSSPPSDCRERAIYYALRATLAIIAGGIVFVVFIGVFGKAASDTLDPARWVPGYPEMDPALGSVGEHNKWKPMNGEVGMGLSLQVLNNLVTGSDWDDYLVTSIREWDDGNPDAVTLNIRSMTYDPDCRAVRRAMKVCNANYGPTDWRGVNQILLQDEFIITSLAKMNDYYMEGTNKAQKQYTMCHELGHGLGLGHSDENFHNEDLGNCMDYTNRPEKNMHPDASNYLSLQELYGNVNGNVVTERLEVPAGRHMTEEDSGMMEDDFEMYAAYLLDPIEVSNKMEGGDSNGSWRLLRKTETAEYHERSLGNGYSIRTSILLA